MPRIRGLTHSDSSRLADWRGLGVEADQGVQSITGINLQLGLPGGQEGGQCVQGAVVVKLQVVAACVLGRVQEQRRGSCKDTTELNCCHQVA